MKLKDTLCLPRTDFPMKASLPAREPERAAKWQETDLAGRVKLARKGRPRWVLHDGPPYANGHVHLGTALNKILKDFALKARSQAGFDTPYVPGWDCHGMPIEHQVTKAMRQEGGQHSALDIRRRCREFAERFLEVQRGEFKRLGVLGDWDDPYLTMDFDYEATIVRAFGELHEAGYVYKGLRSIHWCATCRTALANAEVEHDEAHESTTVHVRFPVAEGERAAALGLGGDHAVVIWTTTPWTLPANVAIALNPELEYVLVGGDADGAIVARDLLERVAQEVGWKDVPVLRSFRGRELEGLVTRHPTAERDSTVVLADYVTTDAGTGCVHTAPGHGAEDFETGRRYELPVLVPVDKSGVFTEEAGSLAGRKVLESDGEVVGLLRDAGALVASGSLVHSYPTCWRCHQPLIFLATDQWFLSVEHEQLRGRCIEAVDATRWIPEWGHDRMRDSVAARPDWCLSRQRAWGVPIPAFTCTACAGAVVSPEIVKHVEAIVAREGSDAWFERSVQDLLPEGTACPECGGEQLEKDGAILDVWFDAACSHLAVLGTERWPDLPWPADLYLEAVDQHRGWFQVSLLNSMALKGGAPYRAVLTHGLILDEDARKMSKSRGNVVSPDEILSTHGADVLRLFFASVDSTADVSFSMASLKPVAESYRKIRNTLRFLLGNLADFRPDEHAVPERDLPELDRHALARLRETSSQVREAWEALAFNRVHRLLLSYLTTDVSSFYVQVAKDCLYAEAPESGPRRSAQTVLFEMAREVTQLLAPVLCFTADEVWEHLPEWSGKPDGVHVASWPELSPPDRSLLERWKHLLAVRDEALKALELARSEGRIRDSLEAVVVVGVRGELRELLESRRELLPELLVVAEASLADEALEPPADAHVAERLEGCWVRVEKSAGTKCPRCWNRRERQGGIEGHPDICARCAEVIESLGVEITAS